MSQFCITGRSHIAALKAALEEGGFDPGGDDYVFIGAPSGLYRNETFVENGVLRGTGKVGRVFLQTSGGRFDHLDPKNFDAVVVYGSHFHLQMFFASILKAGGPTADLYSSAYLRQGAQAWLRGQPTLDRVRDLGERSRAPIVMMFEPFFSEKHKAAMPPNARISARTRDIVYGALRELVEEVGAVCLFQPEETIIDTIYSPHDLAQGSMRLQGRKEHTSEDVTHLNSIYGAHALAAIRDTLTRLGFNREFPHSN